MNEIYPISRLNKGANRMSQKKDKDGLTEKQKKFVEHYEGNAVEACKLAGYSLHPDTLRQQGSKNMKCPAVLKAIEKKEEANRAKDYRQMSQAEVVSKLSEIADNPRVSASAKVAALEKLGKIHNMFKDGYRDESDTLYLEGLSTPELQEVMLKAITGYVLSGNISLGDLFDHLQSRLDARERAESPLEEQEELVEEDKPIDPYGIKESTLMKRFDLTPRQAQFALHYAGDPTKAAWKVGYPNPKKDGRQALANEHIQRAIDSLGE